MEIRDKKGVKNVAADHLSRIPNAPIEEEPINEEFSDKHILEIFKEPWYTDIVNYFATGQVPFEWTKQVDIDSSPRHGSSFGKSHTFSSIVLTKSSDSVYQRKSIGVC